MRKRSVHSPHYSLSELRKLDGRVDAHLDGLRVAGEAGWGFCKEQLSADEPGEVFVAAMMALESANQDCISEVLQVVRIAPETIDGFVSAVGWLPLELAQPQIRHLLNDDRSLYQQIGIAGAAIHRWHPGEALSRLVRSENPALRARALKAVGELGDASMKASVESALRDTDEYCVFAAAWSGTLLGLPACSAVMLSIAESTSPHAEAAADLALRRMDVASARAWQAKLIPDPVRVRLAIRTAGTIGDPSLIPWLISLMDQFPLARLAGESFTTITGVDLAYRDLERKPPEDYNAEPTEDPADDNVDMDPDDNLPWPQPSLVQQWWDANRSLFQNDTRHLLGKPITDDWLRIVLRDGRQRQRAAAALEIAIRNPGQPLFNVKAPGFRQQQLLGKGEVIR